MIVRNFVSDFETTVYDGQNFTEVWAGACVELYHEDVKVFNCIEDTLDYIFNVPCDKINVYFHNLKFDGEFILYYLLHNENFTTGMNGDDLKKEKELDKNEFTYLISDTGQWYFISLKLHNGKIINFKDSLKLLPFSVKAISESFDTKHKKLSIEYTGFRQAHGIISEEEKEYIKNDVLVVKEALEIMFNDGHNKLTIGSCCLSEFRKTFNSAVAYKEYFPDLTQFKIDKNIYDADNVDEYIRKSYKGGWCYLKEGEENKIINNGLTLDVNSLYPFVMHSSSGNEYPWGCPIFWQGEIPEKAKDKYYFVTIRCRFKLRKGYLPFFQKKGSFIYKGNKCLTTSNYFDKNTGKYFRYYKDKYGNIYDTTMTITFTKTDYILFKKHYILYDEEILHGVYFFTETKIFDKYIDKYMEIKMNSKGAKRTEAKLFLNNLYGKMATGTNSGYKIAYADVDGDTSYDIVERNDKKSGYIAIGSAITSYARYWTITHAQENYENFIYADTDSMHMKCEIKDVKGCEIDDRKLGAWKCESEWEKGIFVRQKTYIEYVKTENFIPVEKYYDIKCAGMGDRCKWLFEKSLSQDYNPEELTDAEKEFCSVKRTLQDFKVGLKIPSKLVAKRITGGVILADTTYELR